MMRPKRFLALALVTATVACASQGMAASYPSADITLILPTGPSPGIDPFLRLLAKESEPVLGRKVIVVNKPGASWTLGTADVARGKPDGHLLGLSSNNAVGFQPLVSKVPYDGAEDYQPILKLIEAPVALMVKSDAPWKSLADFVADAKKNPGKLRAALPGLLTQAELVLRLFDQAAGVQVTGVPFTRGGSEMLGAMMGGHVESAVGNPAIFMGQIRAGNARVLAVFSKARLATLPDVPTTVELGHNVTFPVMYFLMGPKNLDREIVDRLVKVYGDIANGPRVQAFAKEHGYLVETLGPERLRKEINEYRQTYRRLVQDLKLDTKR
jgi:tripartite-type tricarboxylate transporter receptor subunit TctC